MKSSRSLLLALVALLISALPALAGSWGDNYKNALATAAQENKKILLDFTGSDWCGWCMKLKQETFDQSQFKGFAANNLVLVEIDFPHSKSLSPEVAQQNAALKEQYHVGGFPTLVLLDSQGNIIKQHSGYIAGGPKAFIDWVNSGK